MKANQHSLWKTDDRAQVGIGTMIVFIATILVAATAAAVLIDTSGKLQERSSTTGDQATKQVASNLIVKSVVGERPDANSNINKLIISVALAPGATQVDVEQMIISMTNESSQDQITFDYAAADADNKFVPTFSRDEDSSANTMTAGDLVNVEINLGRINEHAQVRKEYALTLHPEVGSPVDATFSTPESFATNLVFFLR